jgi:hypothetical protein
LSLTRPWGANARVAAPRIHVDPVSHNAALDELAGSLRERLLARAGAAEEAGEADAQSGIRALVEREAALLDPADREELVARVAERSFGLGPLEPLLRDPEVDEIMVNGTAPVWVERAGRLERTGACFASEAELRHAIERILAPLGRRVDEAEPMCDARMPDRCRVARIAAATETPLLFQNAGVSSGDHRAWADDRIRPGQERRSRGRRARSRVRAGVV